MFHHILLSAVTVDKIEQTLRVFRPYITETEHRTRGI